MAGFWFAFLHAFLMLSSWLSSGIGRQQFIFFGFGSGFASGLARNLARRTVGPGAREVAMELPGVAEAPTVEDSREVGDGSPEKRARRVV